jgi:hypothetical protein
MCIDAPSHHPRDFDSPPFPPYHPFAIYNMFTILRSISSSSSRIAQPFTSHPSSNRQRSTAGRSSSLGVVPSSLTTTRVPARMPIRPWSWTLRYARRRRRRRWGWVGGGSVRSARQQENTGYIGLSLPRLCVFIFFSDGTLAQSPVVSGPRAKIEIGRRRIRTEVGVVS